MTLATGAWRRTLLACLVFSLLLALLFWPTLDTMVTTWLNIETYSHGFVILPISLWLAWRRRDALMAGSPHPAPVVLLLSVGAGVTWALAEVLGVQVIAQLALVALWVTGLWALIGHRAARLLAFPLLFLFLMVPMGESLVPPMMDFTADFTVWMLELTGIPVYRENLYFVIPSGNWSVVEACSGVRYLIASVTLGLLYAYLTYRSLWRRALFVLLSVLVPILANGLRAYMIVMIGHLSDMQLAVGVDHLIYGWVFFGLVMLLLFWIGGLWAEPHTDHVQVQAPQPARPGAAGAGVLAGVLIAGLAVAGLARGAVAGLTTGTLAPPAVTLPGEIAGWQLRNPAQLQWPTRLNNPDGVLRAAYVKDGTEVALVIGLFQRQRQDAEVISSSNGVLDHGADGWRVTGKGRLALTPGERTIEVPVYRLGQQARSLLGETTRQILVARWYRLGSYDAASEYLGKWYQARALLQDGRSDGAFVMLGVRQDGAAAQHLRDFADQALPAVLGAIDRAQAR